MPSLRAVSRARRTGCRPRHLAAAPAGGGRRCATGSTAGDQAPACATSCDAGGCWDSNGTRYNRMGPTLIGPSGVCSQQGAFLNCP